jgi:hypothetical protein
MKWTFKPSGIPELDSNINTILRLKNGDRTASVTLTNDAITVAHKTLGTWKSTAHDQIKQADELEQKSNDYAQVIMASPVTRVDNWSAYYAIYLTKMSFALPTNYLTKKRLKKIEQRAIGATLCKGGFVSTYSGQVAFGPQLYGGKAMRPIKIEQLIQQVQAVMKHLRCPGEIRIAFAWAQLATGMGFALFEWPEKEVAHLECDWMQSLRTGLASIAARIECVEEHVFKHRRMGDVHIMDQICDSDSFTDIQIWKINACRLFLQVTLLSDIASPCGYNIESTYYKGAIQDRTNWPTVQYPRQEKPDKTSWSLWRRALHIHYL